MPAPVRALLLALAAATVAACGAVPQQGIEAANKPQAANRLAEVQTQLGVGYLRAGQLEQAYQRLTRALDADPGYSTAHNAMGTLHERLGDRAQAENHYERAVELNPMDSAAQSNYGSFLCRTGRHEQGEQRFLQALKNSLYDRPEVAYANAGVCMKDAGNLEKAETYFRSALERDPKIPSVLRAMSELSFEKGRHLQARAYLQRYLEVGEHDAATLWLGIRIERELGDRRTENGYAMRLKREFPDSPQHRLLLESNRQ